MRRRRSGPLSALGRVHARVLPRPHAAGNGQVVVQVAVERSALGSFLEADEREVEECGRAQTKLLVGGYLELRRAVPALQMSPRGLLGERRCQQSAAGLVSILTTINITRGPHRPRLPGGTVVCRMSARMGSASHPDITQLAGLLRVLRGNGAQRLELRPRPLLLRLLKKPNRPLPLAARSNRGTEFLHQRAPGRVAAAPSSRIGEYTLGVVKVAIDAMNPWLRHKDWAPRVLQGPRVARARCVIRGWMAQNPLPRGKSIVLGRMDAAAIRAIRDAAPANLGRPTTAEPCR